MTGATDGKGLTERQEIALRYEAMIQRVSYAAIRRQALSAYADQLLADPAVDRHAVLVLRYRREHGINRPVTVLRLAAPERTPQP